MTAFPKSKTVVVLGAAYAGHRAAQLLVDSLPHGWRLVVIERNTHFNHLYAFPRVSVLPGHEHKVFVPYTNIFRGASTKLPCENCDCYKNDQPHLFVHANVTKIEPNRVHFEYLPDAPTSSICPPDSHHKRRTGVDSVDFDYLIYALGSKLPRPINIWDETTTAQKWSGTKLEGIDWHRNEQARIRDAQSVLVVGGGALGVQYASDIASLYPEKKVTLAHSGSQLLPRFELYMHEEAVSKLEELGVKVALKARVDLSSVSPSPTVEKERTVRTLAGETLGAEYILLCTGQKPNVTLLEELLPSCVNHQSGAAYVTRTMQLAHVPEGEDETFEPVISAYPHIYVVGDAADAFGALKAGHTAWGQAEIAADNVVALVKSTKSNKVWSFQQDVQLKHYVPPPPAITVSLGLKAAIYQKRGQCGSKDPKDCYDDLRVHLVWARRGLSVEDMTV